MLADPGYTTVQYRMTAAHRLALARLARQVKRASPAGPDPDRPLDLLEYALRELAQQQGVPLPPRTANPHGGPRAPREKKSENPPSK